MWAALSHSSSKAQSNLTLMNTLVWGTCNTNPGINQCIANMGWFAESLKTQCEADLKDRNTLAVDTLTGESYLSYLCQRQRSMPKLYLSLFPFANPALPI